MNFLVFFILLFLGKGVKENTCWCDDHQHH